MNFNLRLARTVNEELRSMNCSMKRVPNSMCRATETVPSKVSSSRKLRQ